MRSVRTIVVSDLHLGVENRADVARLTAPRERLVEALAAADRAVFMGDTIELREQPLGALLERVRPFFEAAAASLAGKRVTLVPGNHDHAVVEPFLVRWRLDGAAEAGELEWPVERGEGIAGRLAEWMPDAELTLAYPSLRLRPDVYLT